MALCTPIVLVPNLRHRRRFKTAMKISLSWKYFAEQLSLLNLAILGEYEFSYLLESDLRAINSAVTGEAEVLRGCVPKTSMGQC